MENLEECPGCTVLDSCLDMEDKINLTGDSKGFYFTEFYK